MILSKHDSLHSFTGSSGLLKWRTPSGLRFDAAAPNKVLNLDVAVATNEAPDGNGGIQHVYFEVVPNGGGTIYKFARSATLVQPSAYSYSGRLPGADPLAPSPYWGYGFPLDLETVDAGYLDITARMKTWSGDFANGGTIRVYNDTDGVDRRPSNREIYVDEVNGTPGGEGFFGDPVDTLATGIQRAMPNIGAGDTDVGGAIVYVLSDLNGTGGNAADPAWSTGQHHIRVVALGGRHVFRTETPGSRGDADKIWGAGDAGLEANITFEGFDIEGLGFYLEKDTAAAICCIRDVNCESRSAYHVDGGPARVEFLEDDSQPTDVSTGTNTTFESIGHFRHGATNGLLGRSLVEDCVVRAILNEALDLNVASPLLADVLVSDLPGNAANDGVQGWVDITGGVDFDVVLSDGTAARIQTTDRGSFDFATELSELAGNGFWSLKVEGATNAANNGDFPIVGVGYDGQGLPYVEITNASAVAETMTASGRIRTARTSDGAVYDAIVTAPTGLIVKTALTEAGLFGVRFLNCADGLLAFDLSNNTATRLAFQEFVSPYGMPLDFSTATATHLLMKYCSFVTDDISFASGPTWTGTSIVDCAFGILPDDFATGWISGCHFESGGSTGVGATTGSFFGAVSDDVSPLTAQQQTALGGGTMRPDWNHGGPRPTVADWVAR